MIQFCFRNHILLTHMKTKLLFLFSFFCQLILAQVSDQGLLAYYPFNGDGKNQLPGGSAFDLVPFGTGTDVTYVADTGFVSGDITNASGILFNQGKTMVSEGLSNYLNNATNKDLTISYWVNYSNAALMTNNHMHLEGFRSLFVSGKLAWGIRNTAWHTGSVNLSVTNNQWNHIALVYNASEQTFRVYSNGSLIGTTNTSGNSIDQITNKFVVGGGTDDSGNHMESKTFFGRIDEMHVFNRALNSSEITALSLKERPKNPNPTITTQNLLAYYPFNGNTLNALPNGSAFDLTLFENNTPAPTYQATGGLTGGQINNTGYYMFNNGVPFVTEGYANYLNNNPNQNLSISYWVNTNSILTSLQSHVEFFASLYGRGGVFNWGVSTSDGIFSTNTFGIGYFNSWAHVVLVYNSADATIACYVNGNLLQSVRTTPQNSIFRYNNKAVIGGGTNADGTLNYAKSYQGRLDEMYVFNKALSPSEILALFNKQVPTSACPTGNVTLTTQAEVDAFVAQYPNCTQINGSLTISSININNLSGLSSLTSVTGDLNIGALLITTNVSGLQNITSVGGNLNLTSNIQGAIINNVNFLSGLTTIGGLNISYTTMSDISGLSNVTTIASGGLQITNCGLLASLNGLQNITSINGNISISNNSLLVDLTGLTGLTTLNNNSSGSLGNIFINQNNSLTSLNGLQNLTSLTKNNLPNTKTGFGIYNCNNLTDISALGNINNAVVEYIVISNNSNLSSCAINTVCNKLAVNSSWVTITGNATGCESIAVVETACNPCPTGNVTLTTQAEVDAFVAQYPNCTQIDGNLTISGGTVNNLSGLNNITTINGGLSISGTNITVANIFNNLTNITGLLNVQNNPTMTNISGFNALVSTPNTIQINNNLSLTQVSGFNALTTVGLNLNIIGAVANPLPLANISGFSNVQSVGYLLVRNTALTNLSQLSSLQAINFGLSIDNNPLLTSIAALGNCTNAMNGNANFPFRIFNNQVLQSLNGINFSSITNTIDVQIENLNLVENINQLTCLQGSFPTVQIRIMPQLQNLNGLANISGIGSLILLNLPLVTTLPNWNLTQLQSMSISTMPALTSIATLSGVTSMGNNAVSNSIVITGNQQLTNLTGLQNVTSLNNKSIFLNSNANLTDISALNGLAASTLSGLTITGNSNLATCEVEWVCNRIAFNTTNVSISNNATGCESVTAVSNACDALGSDDFTTEYNVKVYPNPFNDQLQLQFHQSIDGILTLLDVTGKVYLTQKINGNQHTINNLGHLAKGIYVVQLQTKKGETFIQKLVK